MYYFAVHVTLTDKLETTELEIVFDIRQIQNNEIFLTFLTNEFISTFNKNEYV